MTLLVAYDGSPAASLVVQTAATLFPGAAALVAYVREPAEGHVPVAAPGVVLTGPALREDEEELEQMARRVAAEGASLAEAAGLRSRAITGVGRGASGVAEQLLTLAADHGATALVIGARSHSGLLAALLGSVCDGVVHKSTIPVLVVPHDRD